MRRIRFEDDSPVVLVRGNNIDDIIRRLRNQTKGAGAFSQIRVPRKNMRRRRRRMEKRLRAQKPENL